MATYGDTRDAMRNVRAHSGRIRQAMNDLPRVVSNTGWRIDRTDAQEQVIREILQEIIGSAAAIAEYLEIEL